MISLCFNIASFSKKIDSKKLESLFERQNAVQNEF